MTAEAGKYAGQAPVRVARAIMASLKGGVVPRVGLPYVTVGRKSEIEALLRDVGIVGEGGAAFRFVVGRYGSGKSFLLQTLRNYAMDQGFVVADADLSPERRLQGTKGQGLATYRELVAHLATKTRPEGLALKTILERWISGAMQRAAEASGLGPEDAGFRREVDRRIHEAVLGLDEMVHGFDFARLLSRYYEAYLAGDEETQGKVLRWFRGEYATRTEARQDLGVSGAVTDENWYEHLKLFAVFFHQAGYKGLLVMVDELVNIYKIPHGVTRNNNYEKILTMYNDTLQGRARHLGIFMGGTPQSVEDTRRGVYSYEALRSRLAEGKFSREGMRDLLAPVIRLEPLTGEEMMVLAEKLADMHAGLYGYARTIGEDELEEFIRIEYGRIGADSHVTPREVIRDFIELLDLLWQNPGTRAAEILGRSDFEYARGGIEGEEDDADAAAANAAASGGPAPCDGGGGGGGGDGAASPAGRGFADFTV